MNPLKHKILRLLADGDFHSGSKIAKELGITRSTVWKHLQAISQLDIDVIAVTGKGYRLARPIELLNQDSIYRFLNPFLNNFVSFFHLKNQLDSTNSFLMQHSNADYEGLHVCLAEQQTSGRGRRGRQWISPYGANIYLSLLHHYQVGPAAISGLSLAVGIGVAKTLSNLGLNEVALKWPNDIYWRNRKLGGILIEVAGETSGPCKAVVGLGLNFHLTPSQAESIDQDWVDLTQICQLTSSKSPGRNKLIANLLNELVPIILNYELTGFEPYFAEWGKWDVMRGKKVKFNTGLAVISGVVQGINSEGLVLIKIQDGITKTYASGEISFHLNQ